MTRRRTATARPWARLSTLATLLAAALAAVTPAQAIVVHLDDPTLSVVQPLSGSVLLDFTGTVEITPGFQLAGGSFEHPYTAARDGLDLGLHSIVRQPGVLFTFQITANDLPGLYAFDLGGGSLNGSFAECPIGGGACDNAPFLFSIEVLSPGRVPEPSSLALLSLGLAGLARVRRRRAGASASLAPT